MTRHLLVGESGMGDNLAMPTEPQQRAWIAQWSAARIALRAQRARELCAMTDRAAVAAAEALLSTGFLAGVPDSRRTYSGLVRQQALLHRRAEP
jgi:hypothetical protein